MSVPDHASERAATSHDGERAVPGHAAQPQPAGLAVRVIASFVDLAIAVVVAALLSSTAGAYFARRAVVALHVGQPGSPWKGTLPMLLGAVSTLAYGVAFAVVLVVIMEALFGTSPGKLLLRREIVPPSRHPTRALWVRFGIKASGAWLFFVALVSGWWVLVVLAAGASVFVLLGFLAVPFGLPALHDRIAGTRVRPRAR